MARKIEFGDLLRTVQPNATSLRVIVHGCNAQGVMGSGFAKQLATLYPGCYETYREQLALLRRQEWNALGQCITYSVDPSLVIANAITQEHFGRDPNRQYVSYRAVSDAFRVLKAYPGLARAEVHYPLIGAGLGGGDWAVISELISQQLDPAGISHTLWLYEP